MEPNIKKYFLEENLIKESLYKTDEYKAIYINEKLFEEIFNIPFEWETSKQIIENEFSITLIKNDNPIEDLAYVDKQKDPFNIALSGNLGSGRAFFYKNIYNIKGQKTSLAISKNKIYSNGYFALSAAIKEAILANIIANDFDENPCFKTLAILVNNKTFIFEDQYLDNDNTIKTNYYDLPCALEIRVYKDKEMLRISNDYINNRKFNKDEILSLINQIAKLEAKKYCERFLHGSWSTGNITMQANMIDFDTSAFVDFRSPQYSNTNKYIDNYFGFEYLGSEKIINKIIEENNLSIDSKLFYNKYIKYLKEYFYKLLGIEKLEEYNVPENIKEELFNLFFKMSKEYTNIDGTFIYNDTNKGSGIYNFSRFFQNYLIERNKPNDIITGLKLLINNYSYNENCPPLTIDKNKEFFAEYFVKESQQYKIFEDAKTFVLLYEEMFKYIDIDKIIYNQYIQNEDRYFLNGYNNIFIFLSDEYQFNKMKAEDISKIINIIINTNLRKISNYNNINLKIFDNFIIYTTISNDNFCINIVPINDFKIKFSKIIINSKEYMVHHNKNKLISEKIFFKTIKDYCLLDIIININDDFKISY